MNERHPRLRRLRIEGFRGVDSLDLSFVEPDGRPSRLAVIAGPNGSGKTTVLEAGLIACGHSDLLRGSHGRQAIRVGAADYLIHAEFQLGEQLTPLDYRSGTADLPVRIPCTYFSSWRAPKLVGSLPVTAGKRGKRPAANEENRLWIIKQSLINAKAYVSMSSSSSSEPSRYEQSIRLVNEIWSVFYPATQESFSVEPAGDTPDEGFDVFLNRKDGTRIPLDALSSGQLELFLLAGSVLPSEQQEAIVFMDEPELHLDPQCHRLILRAMLQLRPHSQFIVGTHSQEIYESVMSYERHFLLPSDAPRSTMWAKESEGTARS